MQPGQATWDEVSNLFTAVGGRPFAFGSSDDLKRYDFYIHSAESDLQPVVFATWERDGVIRGFEVGISPLHMDGGSPFPGITSAFQQYSLQGLLASLGDPTAVLIDARPIPAEEAAPMIYGMWLHWEEAGIAAYYEGEGVVPRGEELSLCPDYSKLVSSRLYLWSVEEGLTLAEMTSATADIPAQIAAGRLRPIQDAAQIQPSEFARRFADAPDGTCVDIEAPP
jgi:hypothetical protein